MSEPPIRYVEGETVHIYCPLCKSHVDGSMYLFNAFQDNMEKYWFACMVMHYRHQHIRYYNNQVQRKTDVTYAPFKHKVNERVKRQILRKCAPYMVEIRITPAIIASMSQSTEQTMRLARKKLIPPNQNRLDFFV